MRFSFFSLQQSTEGTNGSDEIGKCIHGSNEIRFSTAFGKSPLPCCVASARISHLPVISHPLVTLFCGRDYNQLRRYGNMRDQAASYTIVLFLCLCLVLLPNPWPSRSYNGEQARAFFMVGGAASPDLRKSSCLTLELCYPLWKKQGLESGSQFPALPLMPA